MQLDISEKSWENFLAVARRALEYGDNWQSPIKKENYQIDSVDNKKIVIRRLNNSTTQPLGRKYFDRRLREINNQGFIVREKRSGSVAEFSTLVHLHPSLGWSKDLKHIVIIHDELAVPIYENVPNDRKDDIQTFARKARRYQGPFRDILLEKYAHKCCITGTSIDEVIDACHIESHSINGNNDIHNGLLLRSDLHDLFDDGLLFIHPKTLKVYFNPNLRNTEYWKYQHKIIPHMIDGERAGERYLADIWQKKKY